jgi:Cu(I)/Ag(I) efflux system membrane fusion protein
MNRPPAGVRVMALVRWGLVAAAALAAVFSILSFAGVLGDDHGAGAGGLYYCPMHPSVVQDHAGECPICGMTLVPKPAGNVVPSTTMTPALAGGADGGAAARRGRYRCPMHPHRTSDDPNARCPDCGMKLEPWPDAATAEPAAAVAVAGLTPVQLAPERIQLIGMRTAVVKRQPRGGALRTVGLVAASERGLAQVTARFAGWIQKLPVSSTGERVRRGQVLATIYSPEVLQAQQELLVASGWGGGVAGEAGDAGGVAGEAGGLLAAARRRLELLGISPREIEDVLRAGKAGETVALRSPADGYVVVKNAVAGVALQPGTVLFEIADLSTVWVTAEVYEQDIARVHVGQRAFFQLGSYPGEDHRGKVQFVSPVFDQQTRTLQVRVELKNRFDRSGPRLRPGMSGTVYLDLPATTGLMVPAEAVVDTGESRYLFVAKAGGVFEPRSVTLGARAGDWIEVIGGVAEGETVVTTGNFLIDSESRLRAAVEARATGAAR